jgi:hypothetical protein
VVALAIRCLFICLFVCLFVGCRRGGDGRLDQRHSTPATAGVGPSSSGKWQGSKLPTLREMTVIPTSAYRAGLALDADAIYVLTERMAHRLVPGAAPQQIPIENGDTAAATRTDLVYWSQGAIWQVSKTGGKARRLLGLEHQPQFFMAAGDDFAWLDMPVRDHFQIQTTDGHRVRTLFYWPGRIETAAMDTGRIAFVRRDGDSAWRIGSVSVHGGEVVFSGARNGTTPAKLAVAGDIFYYDLDSNEVRRLSADLSREEILAKDLVCSPLAASARVYCPNMAGLFDLGPHPGSAPRPLFQELRRISAVAASPNLLAWLADAGAESLSVMMVPLPLDQASP